MTKKTITKFLLPKKFWMPIPMIALGTFGVLIALFYWHIFGISTSLDFHRVWNEYPRLIIWLVLVGIVFWIMAHFTVRSKIYNFIYTWGQMVWLGVLFYSLLFHFVSEKKAGFSPNTSASSLPVKKTKQAEKQRDIKTVPFVAVAVSNLRDSLNGILKGKASLLDSLENEKEKAEIALKIKAKEIETKRKFDDSLCIQDTRINSIATALEELEKKIQGLEYRNNPCTYAHPRISVSNGTKSFIDKKRKKRDNRFEVSVQSMDNGRVSKQYYY